MPGVTLRIDGRSWCYSGNNSPMIIGLPDVMERVKLVYGHPRGRARRVHLLDGVANRLAGRGEDDGPEGTLAERSGQPMENLDLRRTKEETTTTPSTCPRHSSSSKLKTMWNLQLWGDEDCLRCRSEAHPNVTEGRASTAA